MDLLPPALAFTLALYVIWKYIEDRQICVQCGGWYEHRKDCPFRDE